MCLKTENYCLKTFVKIRVGEKNVQKYVKYCLKTENYCLEILTKHPQGVYFSSLVWKTKNDYANSDKVINNKTITTKLGVDVQMLPNKF